MYHDSFLALFMFFSWESYFLLEFYIGLNICVYKNQLCWSKLQYHFHLPTNYCLVSLNLLYSEEGLFQLNRTFFLLVIERVCYFSSIWDYRNVAERQVNKICKKIDLGVVVHFQKDKISQFRKTYFPSLFEDFVRLLRGSSTLNH